MLFLSYEFFFLIFVLVNGGNVLFQYKTKEKMLRVEYTDIEKMISSDKKNYGLTIKF